MNAVFKSLVVLSLATMTSIVHADIRLNKSEYRYQTPKHIEKLCQAVIKERIAYYTQEGWDLDELDTDPKTACIDVSIELSKTGVSWIDERLNEQSSLPSFQEDLSDIISDLEERFANPKDAHFGAYENIDELSHISTSALTAQFARDFYGYSFGAHGHYGKSLYVFDLQDKKQLSLDDVITTPAKKSTLTQIAKRHFIEYLKSDVDKAPAMTDEEVREHLQSWEFYLNDNFVFTPDGMTFWYSPYQIGPYVMGYVVIDIPKSKLKGVIKDKYLNQTFTHFDDSSFDDDGEDN